MSNSEFDAINEAEKIVRELAASLDVDGEDCPLGDDCPIHFRNDEIVMWDDIEAGRLITYTGDWAIVSDDNPEQDDPIYVLKQVFGILPDDEKVARYEITVIYVGAGSLGDVRALPRREQYAAVRYLSTHDDWGNFRGAHELVVAGVTSGLIDLGTAAFQGEIDKLDASEDSDGGFAESE